MRATAFAACVLVSASCDACRSSGGHPSPPPGVKLGSLTVTSRSFASGSPIPVDLTCDGANRSPQLTWSAPPAGTRTFAIVVDDPDAQSGDFTHWVVANVPGEALSVPEAADLPGASVGLNGFGQSAYGGPCPPRMEIHHYRFIVFALDTKLDLPQGAPREAVDAAMSGHVLAAGTLVGTFSH